MTQLSAILADQLAQPETSWSIGIFGAVAEFHRDVGERTDHDELMVATARGGIRLEPVASCQPIAYGLRTPRAHGVESGVALCLLEKDARLDRRSVVTELGPDDEAIHDKDRKAVLFDLGLNTPYGVFCVRTADPEHLAKLRNGAGRSLFDPENTLFGHLITMSPHRVFMSRLGRIEVYQPIAQPGGVTPPGPHTHLLPKLARRGRTHNANVQLPPGLVPCAVYYPSNGDTV